MGNEQGNAGEEGTSRQEDDEMRIISGAVRSCMVLYAGDADTARTERDVRGFRQDKKARSEELERSVQPIIDEVAQQVGMPAGSCRLVIGPRKGLSELAALDGELQQWVGAGR